MSEQSVGLRGMLSLYKGLPRPVYVLFFATIMNGVGIFVYPFLVLLLTQHLGYSDAWTGAFMSVQRFAYSGLSSGNWLRIGRKRVIVADNCSRAYVCVCGSWNLRLVPCSLAEPVVRWLDRPCQECSDDRVTNTKTAKSVSP
jgi:hypothetical protein